MAYKHNHETDLKPNLKVYNAVLLTSALSESKDTKG